MGALRSPIQRLVWQQAKQGWVSTRTGQNPGLVLDRYLPSQDDNGAGKRAVLEAALAATKQVSPYKQAYEDRQRAIKTCLEAAGQAVAEAEVEVQGRVVIGLGAESVLETGLTLQHTYGTPFIPGSALKGLAAHYCSRVWSTRGGDPEVAPGFAKDGKYYQVLFGSKDAGGYITFHDAWITPESVLHGRALAKDVMTVHHPRYYQASIPHDRQRNERLERNGDGMPAPSDFDSPNPIPFLSITGRFQLILSCDLGGEVGNKWVQLAKDLLVEALQEWGIGGKTNSGYGRMAMPGQSRQYEGGPNRVGLVASASGSVTGKGQPQPGPEGLQIGSLVTATLHRTRTGLKAMVKLKSRQLNGRIVNPGSAPAGAKPDQAVQLRVVHVNPNGGDLRLEWPS